ncbi:hypothetical protein DSOL_1955 [Desulfosporosinus metallidurans]|uniref:Uncharacterized protein n=1 Tax=Desulfosporosinus metallidurans TaxID=1888891 RepID=A0A1Q8QXJ6_9FIRM|nr:hypothetical protein DSOL_1955 [Desulfosporosinus metallidurans]
MPKFSHAQLGAANVQRGDNGGFKTVLDGLVTDGTLTQAQEDAIQSSLD